MVRGQKRRPSTSRANLFGHVVDVRQIAVDGQAVDRARSG
jgi:hypothetical protein